MQDVAHNRQWSWVDGTVVDYFHWAPGEPNNRSDIATCDNDVGKFEGCVELYSDDPADPAVRDHWNDYPCESKMRDFVCKRPATVA